LHQEQSSIDAGYHSGESLPHLIRFDRRRECRYPTQHLVFKGCQYPRNCPSDCLL